MLSLREYREPTHRLPDYLPWACLVAPGVVLQKDGILQKTVAFRGPDLASSSSSELLSAVARLNNGLKRLGSGWAFFVEAQRFEATRYPASTWRRAAAWVFDVERRRAFEAEGTHFESAYYLTIVGQLPAAGGTRSSSTTPRPVPRAGTRSAISRRSSGSWGSWSTSCAASSSRSPSSTTPRR
jgi:type IV secretion system protein VirB4